MSDIIKEINWNIEYAKEQARVMRKFAQEPLFADTRKYLLDLAARYDTSAEEAQKMLDEELQK